MRLFLLALALMLCAPSAFALVARPPGEERNVPMPNPAVNPVFSCKPAGFTLTRDAGGMHLHGEMQMPTPGYTYSFTEEAPGPDGSLHATLRFKAPDGMVIQVISPLAIDHTFKTEGDRLHVAIDKSFNWGDASIDCEMTGMTQ